MEIIQGNCNLLLIWQPNGTGVTLLRAETWDSRAVIPETVGGRPVTAIGHHAFTPGRAAPAGEQLRITCGPVSGEPDNARMTELVLPRTVESVGDYALYNCAGLKTLELHDTAVRWGGSVFMNCRLLDTFVLHLTDEKARLLSYFAGELTRELDVSMTYPDGSRIRLIFPESLESYEENCPAHHFDYNIFGAGYPYHHCFRDRAFSPADFDALWPDFLKTEHDGDCALRLAWWRLRLPRGLGDEAAARYLGYLQSRAGDTLDWLLSRRDMEGFAWFLSAALPEKPVLEAACEQARQRRSPEAQALLLEQLHRRFPAGRSKRFAL